MRFGKWRVGELIVGVLVMILGSSSRLVGPLVVVAVEAEVVVVVVRVVEQLVVEMLLRVVERSRREVVFVVRVVEVVGVEVVVVVVCNRIVVGEEVERVEMPRPSKVVVV
jgi:hypothetical protein